MSIKKKKQQLASIVIDNSQLVLKSSLRRYKVNNKKNV